MQASQRDPGGWYYTFKPLCTEGAIDCSQGSKPFENPAAHRYKHPRQTSVTAHRTLLEMEAPCERSLLAMACDRALTEMRVFKATRVQYDETKAGAVRSGLTGVPASQLHKNTSTEEEVHVEDSLNVLRGQCLHSIGVVAISS